jgi:hypothetical protein
MDDIVFRIGSRDWPAPPLPFLLLERAWPHIQALSAAPDLIAQTALELEIVAISLALKPEPADRPGLGELKTVLRPDEIFPLSAAVARLIRASMPPVPEELKAETAIPGEAMAGSPAIFDPSSPNSPPAASAPATRAA